MTDTSTPAVLGEDQGSLPESLPVRGFEGLYTIYRDGRVYSDRAGRFMSPGLTTRGYFKVTLYRGGACEKHYVHRLVARHFIADTPELCVNHKDGCKTNNVVENLEWTTLEENNRHARETGLRPDSRIPVEVLLKAMEARRRGETLEVVSPQLGFTAKSMSAAIVRYKREAGL